MQSVKTTPQQITAAQQLEKQGHLAEAAAVYRSLLDKDPANEALLSRLLVLYRKQKEYKKELAVIDDALAVYEQRTKTAEAKWAKAHPKAARAGRQVLRQLSKGGEKMSAFDVNPVVGRWIKRREFLVNRISGKKVARKKAIPQKAIPQKVTPQKPTTPKPTIPQKPTPLVTQLHSSLFVIVLHYRAPLEKIDALISAHTTYLQKHYEQGDFLASGRQIPRTGGVIIARGKNRAVVEKIIKGDPFIKKKLATADIIEFSSSQAAKGIKELLKKSF